MKHFFLSFAMMLATASVFAQSVSPKAIANPEIGTLSLVTAGFVALVIARHRAGKSQ